MIDLVFSVPDFVNIFGTLKGSLKQLSGRVADSLQW